MADKKQSKVKADIKRNRLYITLSGHITKNVLDKAYTEIRFCVADLTSGFDVVTDLSQCIIANLNGIATVRKIMDYLIANQAGQIVRIIGKKGPFFRQSLMFATRFSGYSIAYVTTLAEAEEKITGSARRNALRFHMDQQQIEYKVNEEEGKGYIIDVSISGCAVRAKTAAPLAHGMEISLTIPLHQDQDTPALFTIAAKVVRAQEDMFAVQFFDLSDEQKEELYKWLANEAGKEILQN